MLPRTESGAPTDTGGGALTPAPTPSGGFDIGAIAQQYDQQLAGGAGSSDPMIVPLWVTRPPKAIMLTPPRQSGSDNRAKRWQQEISGNPDPLSMWKTPPPDATTTDQARLSTQGAAEQYWIDMSPEERKAFAEKAQEAGFWSPKDGPGGLYHAWSQAVQIASDYNKANAAEPSKWLSPWEALDKLYTAAAAAGGASMNTVDSAWHSNTRSVVKQFSQAEIKQTAQQVLQQELGRNPTDAEVNAYMIAANAAAAKDPQVINEQTRNTAWDSAGNPINSETQTTVQSPGFTDATGLIQDSAQNTQEHRNVKAATDYFNATMQALGSVV